MADVRLTDLEVIQRYSIAVRGETADRDELAAALRADLTWLEGGARPRRAVSGDDEAAAGTRRGTSKPATRKAAVSRATTAKPASRQRVEPAKRSAKKAAKPVARRSR